MLVCQLYIKYRSTVDENQWTYLLFNLKICKLRAINSEKTEKLYYTVYNLRLFWK